MNKKKICFIVALLITGGSDKLLLAQSSVLIKNGFEVVLYAIRPIEKNVLYKEFLSKGVIVKDYSRYTKYFLKIVTYILIHPIFIILKIHPKFNGLNTADLTEKSYFIIENNIIPWICEPLLFFRIYIDTIRFKYNIISASHFSTMRIVYLLKKFLRISAIYTEISSPKSRRGWITRRKSAKYLNSIDKIVVPSKIIGNELIQYEGLNKQYKIVSFFVELPDYFSRMANRKARTFGVIARLSKEKNQNVLIKVLKSILDQGRKAELVLIGEGPEENNYKNLASVLGIIDEISFIPTFNDIKEVIDKIDIFVLCSDVEGMSLSLIEALYFEKPILATNAGANSELVIDGFNGFLIDKSNIKDIADKIISIMDNKDLFQEFSINSKKLYGTKFNRETLSLQLLDVYTRCKS